MRFCSGVNIGFRRKNENTATALFNPVERILISLDALSALPNGLSLEYLKSKGLYSLREGWIALQYPE